MFEQYNGGKGSYYSYEGVTSFFEAFQVSTVDTVGAGDVFCGCLASAIASEKDIAEAIPFASAAAAISVTRKGAQNSASNQQEIEDFMKSQLKSQA